MKTIIHFDIESTGLDITRDRIIQLSLIKTNIELEILEKKKLLLSNCGVPIHPDAFKAHGINEEMLLFSHPFSAYAKQINSYISSCDYISGYNIKGFDVPLLWEEFYRAGINWEPKPIIDSCVIFKQREKRDLTAALKFYCDKEMEGAHDAENDVLATIDILRGQVEKYGLDRYIRLLRESDEIIQSSAEPLENVLISESKYDNEDKRLTFDGRITLNSENIPIWNFGKYKGLNMDIRTDLGYCDWVLKSDFPNQTKIVLRNLIGYENKVN